MNAPFSFIVENFFGYFHSVDLVILTANYFKDLTEVAFTNLYNVFKHLFHIVFINTVSVVQRTQGHS